MTILFRRSARITIDTIEIFVDPDEIGAHLDVAFSVERSLKPEPNTAELQVWNLNADNRSALEELEKVAVQIDAGYGDTQALLYLGNMRTVFTIRDGPDLITNIQSGDGEKEYQQSRINVSIAKGTSNVDVFAQVAKALGVSTGNLDNPTIKTQILFSPPMFPQGTVLSGQVSSIVTQLASSVGLEWSIQGEALQFLIARQPILGKAVSLTPNTGLIGSPSVDNEGVLTAQALLIPDLLPGRIVELESERLSGSFRVETAKYVGNTAADDWFVDFEAKKLG